MLQADKISPKILSEYTYFADIFFSNQVIESLENTNINKHVIILMKGKQPSYRPIYALSLIELKTLKT